MLMKLVRDNAYATLTFVTEAIRLVTHVQPLKPPSQ